MTEPRPTPTTPGGASTPARRSRVALIVSIAVVAAVAALAFLLVRGGGDEPAATTLPTGTAPTTGATTGTTGTTPSTAAGTSAAPTTATTAVPDVLRPALWPWPDTSRRFTDPGPAAATFATEFLGFTDPLVGPFQAGDSRSGEVEIRATAAGPATTVLLRQLGDDGTWWVIGASTPNIEVDTPAAMGAIDHPLQVAGRARTFEGVVEVQVRADGQQAPIGQGTVTGRGDGVLGPFSGEIAWENPGGGWGAVVFLDHSAEDGRVFEATVVRVGFIGGD